MTLSETAYEFWPGPHRYFIDGVRVTKARFERVRDAAKVRDCFLTERISLSGGFSGFRYSQCVR